MPILYGEETHYGRVGKGGFIDIYNTYILYESICPNEGVY